MQTEFFLCGECKLLYETGYRLTAEPDSTKKQKCPSCGRIAYGYRCRTAAAKRLPPGRRK